MMVEAEIVPAGHFNVLGPRTKDCVGAYTIQSALPALISVYDVQDPQGLLNHLVTISNEPGLRECICGPLAGYCRCRSKTQNSG